MLRIDSTNEIIPVDDKLNRVTARHIDPVCNRVIKLNKGYGMIYRGHLIMFCSSQCLEQFESNPDRYRNASLVLRDLCRVEKS